MNPSPSHSSPKATALLLALATFPLIFMGGLVTSHGAGLAVPDWPNSYGYNMFLFPPSQWVGGIFYEHVHRLLGTLAGFLAVMLTIRAHGPSRNPSFRFWSGLITAGATASTVAIGAFLAYQHHADHTPFSLRSHGMQAVVLLVCVASVGLLFWTARCREPRRSVRWLTLAVLGAVIFQGMLGGLRVVKINLDLAVIHGCFAQAFFCLACLTVLTMTRWWNEAPDLSAAKDGVVGKRLMRWAVIAVVAVFGQLVVGAVMRHYRAGLAVPDFPLAYGGWLPPTSEAELAKALPIELANDVNFREASPAILRTAGHTYRSWMGHWPSMALGTYGDRLTPTLGMVWLHFAHRVGAVVVSITLITFAYKVFRLNRGRPLLIGPTLLLMLLLLTQATLGALTVLLRKPADIASAHVACGALVLATTFLLAARSFRLYKGRTAPEQQRAFEVVPGFTRPAGALKLSPGANALRPTP